VLNNVVTTLLEMYWEVRQCKNSDNRSAICRVIIWQIYIGTFSRSRCIFNKAAILHHFSS